MNLGSPYSSEAPSVANVLLAQFPFHLRNETMADAAAGTKTSHLDQKGHGCSIAG